MTESGKGGHAPRSGSGCGVALGIGLILIGGLVLWANLSGTPLALLVLDLLPLAAVWWPLLLVVWGATKVVTRIRTGRARFGIGEVLLLALLVLFGTLFTLAQRVVESRGLQFRLMEISRFVEQQSGGFSRHRFVAERLLPLPAGGATDIAASLPAGNILIEAAPIPAAEPAAPVEAETAPEDAADPTTATPAGSPPREARVRLVKHVWARDREEAAVRAEAVRLAAGPVDGDPARFEFRVEDTGDSEVALELLLTLPPGVSISAVSEAGSVYVEGPFADVEARASDGLIEVGGSKGAVSLTARDGAVRAYGIGGEVQIRGRRAFVEVEAVAGPTSVESDGAPVWISGVRSSVAVRGRNAPVEVAESLGPIEIETEIAPVTVDRIGGSAMVRSAYGSILATAVEGPLRIRTESAAIEVRRVQSAVDISTDGGSVLVEDVSGTLAVASGRGEVRALGLVGPARFAGNAGAITVRDFRNTLSVEGGDADVDVRTDALGGELALTTDRGDIRLTLPSTGAFTLSARVEDGEIESDFALERTDVEGTTRWVALAGSGAERVTISTARGDVAVRTHTGPPSGETP